MSPLLQPRFFKEGGAGIQGADDVGKNTTSVTEKGSIGWLSKKDRSTMVSALSCIRKTSDGEFYICYRCN
jgi:hypothetical protein